MSGAGGEPLRDLATKDKTADELLAERVYQKVNQTEGVFEIDRVSRDGPRDRVGEFKDRLNKEIIYDLSRAPGTGSGPEIEEKSNASFTGHASD